MASAPRNGRPLLFKVLAATVIPVMSAMADIRIQNGDKLPKHGAFVLAPNHYSEIDPIVIGIAVWKLGRVPRFLAKGSLFKLPVVGAILRKTGQVPVERGGSGKAPMLAARSLVNSREPSIVYPEGTLTRDPDLWPMRGKLGAVRTALAAGVPLVPVAHWGTQTLMPRYGKRIRPFPRKRIELLFGDPVDLSRFEGKIDTETLVAATDELMAAITALLATLRNETPPAERWDPADHKQTEHGRFTQGAGDAPDA